LTANTKEEPIMSRQRRGEMAKPVARLAEMSEDEASRYQMLAWDRARRDEEARIRLKRAEGEARGKAEAALNQLIEELPVAMSAKVTGLSPDEIERLSDNDCAGLV
jgi:hypothetical protein